MRKPSTEKRTVLVFMGGPDAEREVSLNSGREVAAALRECNAFNVHEQIIDAPSAFELRRMITSEDDIVFPVLHGRWGEGGALQDELELLGLPYVGCRPQAARLAMDKLVTKSLLADMGVPTPPARQLLTLGDACDLDPPIVLKPVDDGSSVDLRICRSQSEIDAARRELHLRRGRLMAERYIKGRELTVGIVGQKALPIIEIIPNVEFYDYEAKYTRDDTRYVIDPALPSGVAEQCVNIALGAFTRLGCRDISRVDIMLDEHGPWFLEINTMPGFTTHSLVPMAARSIGWQMPKLCATLVEAALTRGTSRSPAAITNPQTRSSLSQSPRTAVRR